MLVGRDKLAGPALSAVVLPAISVDGRESVERLPGAGARAALLGCSRHVAMHTPDHARSMLGLAATLSRSVPTYRVSLRHLTQPMVPEPVRALLEEHLGFTG